MQSGSFLSEEHLAWHSSCGSTRAHLQHTSFLNPGVTVHSLHPALQAAPLDTRHPWTPAPRARQPPAAPRWYRSRPRLPCSVCPGRTHTLHNLAYHRLAHTPCQCLLNLTNTQRGGLR
jgi:hypothetical protein